MTEIRSIKRRVAPVIAFVIAVAMTAAFLFGCALPSATNRSYAEFTTDRIELEAGEEFDLGDIIYGNTDTYTLKSSDTSIVALAGKIATALSTGRASITANSGDAISKLTVSVRERDSFSVETSGEPLVTVGSSIELTPVATGDLYYDDVDWKVGDGAAVTRRYGEPYVFSPSAPGVYTVTAMPESDDKFAFETQVRAYNAVEAYGSVTGALTQSEPYSAVTLSASVARDDANPERRIMWTLDGETLYFGENTEYVLTPAPGAHILELFVNGEKRKISGADSLRMVFKGSVVPDKITLDFDNLYPDVFLRYDAIGAAAVEVIDVSGEATVYSEADGRYADLFFDGAFNVKDFVDICAVGTPKEYKFRVKSLGDGEVYTESGFSDYFAFAQLPSNTKKYIETYYLDRDLYITSDEEFVDYFEYNILFRTKRPNTEIKFDCYIGYDCKYSADELWTNAFNIGATSGSYSTPVNSIKNGVFSTEFTVKTVNSPSTQTYTGTNANIKKYAKQLHSVLPHINYDVEKYRPADHEFPIDNYDKKSSVRYTDELYFAAEHKVTPEPVKDSPADIVYEKARDVMRKIVTDDMTDREKAHTIYDWVMWQVTYDMAVVDDKGGEKFSSYYLEGVFGDGVTDIAGITYYPYAVCDGISKAYSLLCNIEGIPCVRVAGMAGNSLTDSGGHAWNKVLVDGTYYVVDCTWGDAYAELEIDGKTEEYELGLHNWLFLTDAQSDPTHFEPYEYGKSDFITAPEAPDVRYDIYTEMNYFGTVIDCTVGAYDQIDAVERIVTEFINAYEPVGPLNIPGGAVETFTPEYISLEIKFTADNDIAEPQLKARIEYAIKKARPSAEVTVSVFERFVGVTLKQ